MEDNKLNISLIKKLLYLEVKDYYEKEEKKKELISDATLLEEMINILSSEDYNSMHENYLLFDSVIPIFFNIQDASTNILKALYKHITYCKNYTNNPDKYLKEDYEKGNKYIKNLINKLNIILEQINAEIVFTIPNITEETIIKYKEIMHNLKFNQKLTANDYKLLEALFKSKGMDDKSIIILFEKVKSHNIITHFDNKRKIDYDKLNEITNIMLTGFEELEKITWIEDKRRNQLDSVINTIIEQEIDEEITPDLLPKYNGNLTFTENYSLACVKYIYTNLLRYYQNEILKNYKDLNNLNTYQDKECREIAVKLYKEALQNYIFIRKLMEKEINKYNQDIEKVNDENDVKKIYFGVKESGTTYLESDLKNMPKDTYSSIRELLMLLKKDILKPAQTKALNDAFPGNLEIKDGQIRIIYRHIKENEYVIVGVFIKKDDNPTNLYKIYCNRKPDSIVESNNVEEEIFNKLSPHSGGRRNS